FAAARSAEVAECEQLVRDMRRVRHCVRVRRPRPLPHALHELPFNRQAALREGLTDRRLRATDLVRPFHGVRVSEDLPVDLPWLCRAYQERMRSGVAFSHLTAATLYGLPLPLYLQSRGELHVTVKAGRRPPEGQSIVGHELDGAVWKARDLV